MEIWTLVGTSAAICGAISLVPEVIKGYRTHHLQDVSWGMLFLLLCSSTLWGAYGIHIQDTPLVLSASINIVMGIVLVVMKKVYQKTRKPLKEHFKRKAVPALETVETKE